MPRTLKAPSSQEIADKWADVTPGRSGYYEANVVNAGALWEQNTKNAKGTYKTAMADPKIADKFAGGVAKAGASKFERKVREVGVSRYGPGIGAGKEDMASGIAPYRDVIDGMSVPDRKPRGDPSNYKIGETIGKALHNKRLSILGAKA